MTDDKVYIYFNLHKKMFSVKNLKTGLVIAHVNNICLREATFKVSEQGRQRVVKERVKNVHAGVTGYIIQEIPSQVPMRKARYNPYSVSTFIDKESSEPVFNAEIVIFEVHSMVPTIKYLPKN